MDDSENKIYVVTAVYKLPKENTVFRPGFVTKHPNLLKENEYDKQWTNYSYVGYFKLKPGADIDALEKTIRSANRAGKIAAEKWGEKYDEKYGQKFL